MHSPACQRTAGRNEKTLFSRSKSGPSTVVKWKSRFASVEPRGKYGCWIKMFVCNRSKLIFKRKSQKKGTLQFCECIVNSWLVNANQKDLREEIWEYWIVRWPWFPWSFCCFVSWHLFGKAGWQESTVCFRQWSNLIPFTGFFFLWHLLSMEFSQEINRQWSVGSWPGSAFWFSWFSQGSKAGWRPVTGWRSTEYFRYYCAWWLWYILYMQWWFRQIKTAKTR